LGGRGLMCFPSVHYDYLKCRSRNQGRVADLARIRLVANICLLVVATMCHAQVPAPALTPGSLPTGSSVNRRVEVLIRSQFSVPSGYDIVFGEKTKSDIPGYDTLPVTFINGSKQSTATFLISKDCSTLVRLEKFDISKDPALSIQVDGRPVRGDDSAKVEIINFDDLECPYCARLNSELSTQTLEHYKGLIKIVYKDYPIEEIHPWAMHAAVDAGCLADLNAKAYWAFVDFVHAHERDISGAQFEPAKSFLALDHIADTFGAENKVDEAKLGICLKRQDEAIVRSSLKSGESLGIHATPQMFVNGERLTSGARPAEELWPAIDRALKAEGIQPPPK
jgi:protein-disulfide isomerase